MQRFFIVLLIFISTNCFANLANYVHVRETIFWDKLYTEKYHTLYCALHKKSGVKSTITHAYPIAWMANAMNCPDEAICDFARYKDATADLHNMWPVEKKLVMMRKHYTFTDKKYETEEGKTGDCNFTSFADSVEPRQWAKGEIARSLLYMMWKYRMPDYGQIPLMVEWANTYPPNAEEKWRNEKIKQIQNNNNPFISDPKRVNDVFKMALEQQ